MATNKKDEDQQAMAALAGDWIGGIKEQFRRITEHPQFPVWAGYFSVYGSMAFLIVYKFRAVRKAEDRLRARQEVLRRQYEAEEAAAKKKPQPLTTNSEKPQPLATNSEKPQP